MNNQSLVLDEARRSHGFRPIMVIVGATVAMGLGFGGMSILSVFMRPLEVAFGWSRSEISLAYMLATAGMAIGGVIWGRLSDRLDTRLLLLAGGAGMTISMASMATASSLWQLYAASLAFGGLGFAVLYAPLLSAPGEWFEQRRGLVIGIVTAGGALGQGLVPFLAAQLIEKAGWRLAFVAIAAVMLFAFAALLPFVVRPLGKSAAQQHASLLSARSTAQERRRMILLAMAAFTCCACMGAPIVHLANFVGAICGSPALGATALLVAMIAGAFGRVFFGIAADRLGSLRAYATASAIQTLCILIFPLLETSLSLLTLSAVFGVGFAGNMTCLTLCVREAVPAYRFGSAIGIVMLVAWAGMGTGGYLAGRLFDVTFSYAIAFTIAGAMGFVNLLIIAIITTVATGKVCRNNRNTFALAARSN